MCSYLTPLTPYPRTPYANICSKVQTGCSPIKLHTASATCHVPAWEVPLKSSAILRPTVLFPCLRMTQLISPHLPLFQASLFKPHGLPCLQLICKVPASRPHTSFHLLTQASQLPAATLNPWLFYTGDSVPFPYPSSVLSLSSSASVRFKRLSQILSLLDSLYDEYLQREQKSPLM